MPFLNQNVKRLPLLVPALVWLILILTNLGAKPVWDAVDYFESCLLPGTLGLPASWMNLSCWGHNSLVFMGLHSLAQLLAFGSYDAVLVTNALLGLLGIYSFYIFLREAYPGEESKVSALWMTTLLAANPTLVANAVQLSPDFGVAVFVLVVLVALLRRHPVLGFAGGCGLLLSKEHGLALFPILVFSAAVSIQGIVTAAWKWILGALILLASYFSYRVLVLEISALWTSAQTFQPLGVDPFGSFSTFLPTFLKVCFVLNFQWLLVIGALIGWIDVQFHRDSESSGRTRRFVGMVWLLNLFVLSFLRFFMNPRYYLSNTVLTVLAAAVSLTPALRRMQGRRWLQVLQFFGVVVMIVSNFLSIDPISRGVFGTFRFGDRTILVMQDPKQGHSMLGRDQLVYNLQYRFIGRLERLALEQLQLRKGVRVFMHRFAFFPRNPSIGEPPEGVTLYGVPVFDPQDLSRMRPAPERAFYLVHPTYRHQEALETFRNAGYSPMNAVTVQDWGYSIEVWELRRTETGR